MKFICYVKGLGAGLEVDAPEYEDVESFVDSLSPLGWVFGTISAVVPGVGPSGHPTDAGAPTGEIFLVQRKLEVV